MYSTLKKKNVISFKMSYKFPIPKSVPRDKMAAIRFLYNVFHSLLQMAEVTTLFFYKNYFYKNVKLEMNMLMNMLIKNILEALP